MGPADAERFSIMNMASGLPWLPLIAAAFAGTVRASGFEALHLDRSGSPKPAHTTSGGAACLAAHLPALIEAARAAVTAVRPDERVIFKPVGNLPIGTVAPTNQDATYIEAWPDESDDVLRRRVRDSTLLVSLRPVILTAYFSPFADGIPATPPRANAPALLGTATIAASGGSHPLLGERHGTPGGP